MSEPGGDHEFPPAVRMTIRQRQVADYRAAADFINREAFDIVCLQYELGIFGGEAGALILGLVARPDAPLVNTLHTALRSEEHTTDLQSLMRNPYAVLGLKKTN